MGEIANQPNRYGSGRLISYEGNPCCEHAIPLYTHCLGCHAKLQALAKWRDGARDTPAPEFPNMVGAGDTIKMP